MTNAPNIGIDALARQWREFFSTVKFDSVVENDHLHVRGALNVYRLTMSFHRTIGDRIFLYAGQTGGGLTRTPRVRLNEHKNRLRRCSTTTFVGNSALYDPDLVEGLTGIHLRLSVMLGGLTAAEAKAQETALALRMLKEWGPSVVLTRPTGSKALLTA